MPGKIYDKVLQYLASKPEQILFSSDIEKNDYGIDKSQLITISFKY